MFVQDHHSLEELQRLPEFRGPQTQLRREWSLVDLGQAAYDLGDTPRRARLTARGNGGDCA